LSAENHKLTAIAHPKNNFHDWNHGLSISFKIFVPQNVSADITTSGGSITLSSLTGTENFITSGGSLKVDHLKGHIKGRTSGGGIILSDLQDDIDLSTSGGNISADNTNGHIKLATSGGSVTMRQLRGNITATTSGGRINASNIDGELFAHTSGGGLRLLDLTCSVDASTSGGSIDVAIKSLGKYVKLSNSGGHTNLEVPQSQGMDIHLTAEKVSATALNGFKGDIKRDRIEGSLNGGGIPINVHGGNNITLTMK
jgi:DUF4097 and DUF4098 domain-containing protein YvlB